MTETLKKHIRKQIKGWRAMSEINIMDFDPSSSIKSYNFTNTAIRRFYDTIDSEQFKDEKRRRSLNI